MALGRALAVAIVGLHGRLVEVEADIATGLPTFGLVGLPDASLQESRDRVRAAAANSGFPLPQQRITVNLSPAALPKAGTGFDLAVAAALLSASGTAPAPTVNRYVHIGELGPRRPRTPGARRAARRPRRGRRGPPGRRRPVRQPGRGGADPRRTGVAGAAADGRRPPPRRRGRPGRGRRVRRSRRVPDDTVDDPGGRHRAQASPPDVDLADVIGQRTARHALGGRGRRPAPPAPHGATRRGQDHAGRSPPGVCCRISTTSRRSR